MAGKGNLENQLEAMKSKAGEIASKKETLRRIEELGSCNGKSLIFDNR